MRRPDPDPTGVRGRFAPSPTGPLHFGSLLAAFGSWLHARHLGGEWWIRIEDVDRGREVPGAARGQLRDLARFGLESDGPVAVQSTRGDRYAAALDRLLADGVAFACHCSRADVAATGGVHRACRPGARRDAPAIRFRVPDGCRVAFDDAVHGHVEQDVAGEVGDFVLRRADGWWAYQLAVVVDDAGQDMTDIVRGADLLDSTPRQCLLQAALGYPRPRYLHLPLVLGDDGRKLSKSTGALALDPADPLPALRAAWRVLGQDPARWPGPGALATVLSRAASAFDPARIPRGPVTTTAVHNAAAEPRA